MRPETAALKTIKTLMLVRKSFMHHNMLHTRFPSCKGLFRVNPNIIFWVPSKQAFARLFQPEQSFNDQLNIVLL